MRLEGGGVGGVIVRLLLQHRHRRLLLTNGVLVLALLAVVTTAGVLERLEILIEVDLLHHARVARRRRHQLLWRQFLGVLILGVT